MTARPDAPVSDERLAQLLEIAAWGNSIGTSLQVYPGCWDDLASALRELQRLRKSGVSVATLQAILRLSVRECRNLHESQEDRYFQSRLRGLIEEARRNE